MTNEGLEKEAIELEKNLKETQQYLLSTQKHLFEVKTMLIHLLSILKTHAVIDDLDVSYIQSKLTEEEYVKKYKEQNNIASLFASFFTNKMPFEEKSGEENKNETSDSDDGTERA